MPFEKVQHDENPIALSVVNVNKRVVDADGELVILQGISFSVRKGETVAIMGPSGSGKSTLLGLLAGLDLSTTGSVYIDGIDIFQLNEDERANLRKEKLGFVFQSFQLLEHLTALENVMLPLELQSKGMSTRQIRERAEVMLERVGLCHRLKHYPRFLSGGEQQRVALARAFVTEPPFLFADEPTGSLDTATGQMVMELMFALNHERASTLILVTHDLRVAKACDRILHIVGGGLCDAHAQ